jgi:AraC-like DNA-binding protein
MHFMTTFERTLRTAFEEYFGVSPTRYLKLRTLHQARSILKRSEPDAVSVTEVAVGLGYGNSVGFRATTECSLTNHLQKRYAIVKSRRAKRTRVLATVSYSLAGRLRGVELCQPMCFAQPISPPAAHEFKHKSALSLSAASPPIQPIR